MSLMGQRIVFHVSSLPGYVIEATLFELDFYKHLKLDNYIGTFWKSDLVMKDFNVMYPK